MRRLLACAFLLTACEPAPPPPPTFDLFEVVGPEVARLEAALELPPASLPDGRAEEDVAEEVRGLVTFLSSAEPALRQSALSDVEALGDCAVPILGAVLVAAETPEAERVAAIEMLGALDSVRSSAQLLSGFESGSEGWIRAHCAWRLGQGTQEWVVPRLVHRLKYETDGETVIWCAVALAKFGNYAGLVGLRALVRSGATEEVRATAARELAALAQPFDAAELARYGSVEDGSALSWAWERWDGAPDDSGFQPRVPMSDRYQLEIWRRIDALGEFQLRRVDDARFVLSRLGPTAALCLARALHDTSRYVRVHSAQALERMGPRGSVAGPDLVRALADPDLAPTAAEALGRVGHPDGAAALEEALAADRDLGLRVAAARALGRLGLAKSADALRPLLSEREPIDLRQAAAESIAYCGAGEDTAGLLCDLIESGRVDPASSLDALSWWLGQRARREVPGSAELLRRWNALAAPTSLGETPKELAARTRERVALVRGVLEKG